jgi:hypothetical protein
MNNRGWILLILVFVIVVSSIFLLTNKDIALNRQTVSDETLNGNSSDVTANAYCSANSDCVAASCCHPKTCVVKSGAPSCSKVFCTEECASGSLDCGQGSCACVENKCKAVFK